MTREEAIKGFEDMKKGLYPFYPDEYFDMAIKALEQEPMVEIDLYSVIKQKYIEREVLDKIRAEIEQLSTSTCAETRRIYIDADNFKENVLEILDKYKTDKEQEDDNT